MVTQLSQHENHFKTVQGKPYSSASLWATVLKPLTLNRREVHIHGEGGNDRPKGLALMKTCNGLYPGAPVQKQPPMKEKEKENDHPFIGCKVTLAVGFGFDPPKSASRLSLIC